VPWHRDTLVTGAAADEHNLNVVDCDASVTVPRLSSISVLWGSGGYLCLCPALGLSLEAYSYVNDN
jgi:hypothetical protein